MTSSDAIKQLDGAELMLFNREFKPFQQAILMAIAALKEQEECAKNAHWISTNDAYPDEEHRVLVYNAKNGSYGVARHSERWQKWRSSGSTVVTHWMPLPNPPEVTGKEETDVLRERSSYTG